MSNNIGKIIPINIKNEMKKSYIDYAMSVIVSRALPDIRDGLKPVHRRILYSMYELGLAPDKGYRKSARIVGDVLGKYHPHGDSSIYDATVRMAQDFSLRYPLVNGHGNFGSVDGDSAAAMRYTEAKMQKITMELLRDLGKETVDFTPNFDGEEKEPTVLPARFPNLLVNGSSGIAVGMATNIPPHNLTEITDGLLYLIDNPECEIYELCDIVKGPDFPTAGMIMGVSGIKSAYNTGRGRVIVRAKTEIEEVKGKPRIIVTEIPYQTNKAKLIESIANLVKDKKVEGITDIRDESNREGMRIVIDLRRDANANVILNRLYKHTRMQDTFGVNMLALVNGEPKVLNLKEAMAHYIEFQKDIVRKKTQYELNKAQARAHILEGLRVALDHIDEVISLIRASKSNQEAKEKLIERFELSEKQVQAILDMKLQRLTGLEREKIDAEYAELMDTIAKLKAILEQEELLLNEIREYLIYIKEKFGDERRTEINYNVELGNIDIGELIPEEQVVITLTHSGYIKRLKEDTYSAQRRGGRGIQGMATKEDDFVEHMFTTSTHDNILVFTDKGRVYRLMGYDIPEASRNSKGQNIINLLPLETDEKIQAIRNVKDFNPDSYLILGTKNGIVKKTSMDAFKAIRKSGLIAITLKENDELVGVRATSGNDDVMFVTKNGYSIRFNEEDVRSMGRTASGVRAISLREGDEVVSMIIGREDEELLVVSEYGLGKRTSVEEYPLRRRGGKGVITYKVTEKTGTLVGARIVTDEDELMLINSNGIVIRLNVSDISVTSRNTMGVKLMRSSEDEKVVTLAKLERQEDELTDKKESSEENTQAVEGVSNENLEVASDDTQKIDQENDNE